MLAYKFDTVHLEVLLMSEVLDDVPLIHPLGNETESICCDRRAKEGQDVWVVEVFPSDCFFAEPLHLVAL